MNINKIISILLIGCSTSVATYPYVVADSGTDSAVKSVPDAGLTSDAGPLLWTDANLVLATAWCNIGVRCGTGDYTFLYGSGSSALTDCITFNNEGLCYSEWEGIQMCESLYPADRYENLDACPTDSATVDCEDGDLNWVLSCNLAAPWAD